MATQGLVSVVSKGSVVMKIAAGSDGHPAGRSSMDQKDAGYGSKGVAITHIENSVIMNSITILRQSDVQGIESRIASQYAITSDVPIKHASLSSLDAHTDALRSGYALPVGSVEFVRKAMSLAGIAEPSNISYPLALKDYLRRNVTRRHAGTILGHWFIKPTTTKTFTGFVFNTLDNPEKMDCHDRMQYSEFLLLPPDTQVWISDPVVWQSEWRYYVVGNQVLGSGRYDDGPDVALEPDADIINEMAENMAASENAPAAFTLDVGVLDSGETALIECNDAWAIGYYKGTLTHNDYMLLLWTRWNQLAN